MSFYFSKQASLKHKYNVNSSKPAPFKGGQIDVITEYCDIPLEEAFLSDTPEQIEDMRAKFDRYDRLWVDVACVYSFEGIVLGVAWIGCNDIDNADDSFKKEYPDYYADLCNEAFKDAQEQVKYLQATLEKFNQLSK